MDDKHAVTDPTDWLATSLPEFSALESSLRCQVCKDFFTNPVLTSCAHTFCSLCIRRCLSADGRCPACRESDQASKLRRNGALEEVVATFVGARPKALQLATADKHEEGRPAKRRRIQADDEASEPPSSQRQTRSRAKMQEPVHEPIVVADDDDADGDYTEAAPQDGLVACPICNGRMKETAVYDHVTTCDGTRPVERKSKPAPAIAIQQTRRAPQAPQERLPELNYAILNDNTMRKKLNDIGIPRHGSKAQMVRRHTEWINLWNSNCDSLRPKSKRELLRDLDVWERATTSATVGPNAIMKKDFDAKGYAKDNHDDFRRLIEEAKAKARAKKTADEEATTKTTTTTSESTTNSTTEQQAANPRSEEPASQPNGIAHRPSVSHEESPALLSQALGNTTPPKKVPMFALPGNPVSDIEGTEQK